MASVKLGSKTEGSIIELKEDGKLVEFYVAKHDHESGPNGEGRTLVVRRYAHSQQTWNKSGMNIRWNPFDFKLVDVIPADSKKRGAMTEEQQDIWMTYIREDKTYAKYYDEFVVLLGTGMRVSEFCGLTVSDLDFEHRRIRVDHQLIRERGGKYYVEKTKTACGVRSIPMTDDVYQSLKNILARRKKVKVETIVDGYGGFILLDKSSKPKVALHIENEMRWAMRKYGKPHPDRPLPNIMPPCVPSHFLHEYGERGHGCQDLAIPDGPL